MEFEKGKWYKLKTTYDWYAKFKCFIGNKWVYEEKISIPSGQYEKQTHEGGWTNFRISGYSGTLLTDLSEIQKYLPKNHLDLIKNYDHEVVHCTTEEELDYACKILKQDKAGRTAPYCLHTNCNGFDTVEVCKEQPTKYKIYSFEEWKSELSPEVNPDGILERGKTCVLELDTNNLLEFSFKPDNDLIFNSKKNNKFVVQVEKLQEPILIKQKQNKNRLIIL